MRGIYFYVLQRVGLCVSVDVWWCGRDDQWVRTGRRGKGGGGVVGDCRRLSSPCRGDWPRGGAGALSGDKRRSPDTRVHVSGTGVALGDKERSWNKRVVRPRYQTWRHFGGLCSVTPGLLPCGGNQNGVALALSGKGTLNLQKRTRVDNTTVIGSSRRFIFTLVGIYLIESMVKRGRGIS